jgi:hypothetical protein
MITLYTLFSDDKTCSKLDLHERLKPRLINDIPIQQRIPKKAVQNIAIYHPFGESMFQGLQLFTLRNHITNRCELGGGP